MPPSIAVHARRVPRLVRSVKGIPTLAQTQTRPLMMGAEQSTAHTVYDYERYRGYIEPPSLRYDARKLSAEQIKQPVEQACSQYGEWVCGLIPFGGKRAAKNYTFLDDGSCRHEKAPKSWH